MPKNLKLRQGDKEIQELGDKRIGKFFLQYFEKVAGVLQTKGKLTKALLKERAKGREKEE